MLTELIRWADNALICLLVLRALRGRFVSKYPAFYFYLTWVLGTSLLRFYIYRFEPAAYQLFYWYSQFFSVAIGCCLIWEIYRQALADYPGAGRMAQRVLWVVFVVVLGRVIASGLSEPTLSLARSTAELERNFRTVQVLLLLAVLGLLVYYAIPIGRNLRGIILGYGLFLGTSVINLTLRSQIGEAFQAAWQYLQPMAYFFTLVVWTVALWSYQPNPKPEKEIAIERDYEVLAAHTANTLARARSYILGTVRP